MLSTLYEKILFGGTLDEKLHAITDGVVDMLDADFARIWIMRPCDKEDNPCTYTRGVNGYPPCTKKQCLHLLASTGRYTKLTGERRRVPAGCLKIGEIIEGRHERQISNDIYKELDAVDLQWARKNNLQSFAGYRLVSGKGNPIGVLVSFLSHEISLKDEEILDKLSNTGSHVIQNALSEEVLSESLLKLDQAVKASNVGLWDWDLSNNEVHFSTTWKKQIGYEDHEIADDFEEWRKRVHPEDLDGVEQLIRHCLEERSDGFETEFRFKHRDGSYLNILAKATMIKNEAGNPRRFIGSHLDISERVHSEQALAESEERFRVIATQMTEGITLADSTGKYLYANPSFCSMSGYSLHELIGMTVFDMKADLDAPNTSFEGTKKYGAYTGEYISLRKKDGSVYHTRVHGKMITLGGKELALGVVTDISNLKEKEDSLREANATKDKFFSIISHDLKGPIGSVAELTSYVGRNFDSFSKENLEVHISTLDTTLSNVYKLLEDLLDWSRSQQNKIELKAETIMLTEYFEVNLEMIRQSVRKKEITISLGDDGVNHGILADRKTANTILRNLLSNAVKFTSRKGQVFLSGHRILEGEKPFVQICVKDNGTGIAMEKIPKLFKIENDVSTPGTENESGTGLGLILCKEFVEKNGGRIWVESEENKGTSFCFTLPSAF